MKNYQTPWLAVSILAFSFAGCAGLNDAHYESGQKIRAVKEYVKCGNPGCERFPHDYKLGWIDGFYNISTGGPSCPPAVAPQRYWDPKQVLKDCDNRRHAYYSGWQDGASRATQFPDTHHLKIFETCECPMPRCESACGPGGCVPCGLGSVGSPVHAELIEMHYDQESIIPTPVVPPAPIQEDDDADEQVSDEADDTANLPATDQVQRIAAAELEMLESDMHEAKATASVTTASDVSGELVRKNDATSIFGAAYDVNPEDTATVQLQVTDPLENAEATSDSLSNNSKPEELATETIKVVASEPKIIVPAPSGRRVKEEENKPAKTPALIPAEGMVKLVEDIIVPPAKPRQSEKQTSRDTTVVKAKSAKKASLESKQVTKEKSIRHPAVAKETIPVRFEMIESDIDGNAGPVVQAK